MLTFTCVFSFSSHQCTVLYELKMKEHKADTSRTATKRVINMP